MRRTPSALALAVTLLALILSEQVVARADTNDPFSVLQWGWEKVEAEAAWSVTKGKGAVVAVIDTGVDLRHPDLKKRLLAGRDFADDDLDPSDENGHGTLVAGIIAANSSNREGVASVAPEAMILPVRVLGADGTGSSDDVAEGIRWAVDKGADVINLSLAQEAGGGFLGENLLRDPAVDEAIEDAAGAGATVVIAAGNDSDGGEPETAYDAGVGGVLVVGATTKTDRRAAYAHFGEGLDMVAPGGGSSTDPSDDGCTAKNAIVTTWWDPAEKRSDYGGGCGTSMAVGFVSAAAAMLHTRGLTNVEAAAKLMSTADDLGATGRDLQFGAGRLNVRRALGAKARPTETQPRSSGGGGSPGVKSQSGPGIDTKVPEQLSPPTAVRPRERRPDVSAALPLLPDRSRGWPVAAAAGLALMLTAAHCWLWATTRVGASAGSFRRSS